MSPLLTVSIRRMSGFWNIKTPRAYSFINGVEVISHEYQCIFIHIQRCAGSSVEEWVVGQDWWHVEPETKHLIASQARKVYAEYWDNYFKFSIVRNPITRTLSMLKFKKHFGLFETKCGIDFSGYEQLFGEDIILEHDYRFANRAEILCERHRPSRLYGNILDERVDFIAHFESLYDDMATVRMRLGIPAVFNSHLEKSAATDAGTILGTSTREKIGRMYGDDFERFGYSR